MPWHWIHFIGVWQPKHCRIAIGSAWRNFATIKTSVSAKDLAFCRYEKYTKVNSRKVCWWWGNPSEGSYSANWSPPQLRDPFPQQTLIEKNLNCEMESCSIKRVHGLRRCETHESKDNPPQFIPKDAHYCALLFTILHYCALMCAILYYFAGSTVFTQDRE